MEDYPTVPSFEVTVITRSVPNPRLGPEAGFFFGEMQR